MYVLRAALVVLAASLASSCVYQQPVPVYQGGGFVKQGPFDD